MKIINKLLIAGIVFIVLQSYCYSQHCPFDNIAILVVDIRDSVFNTKIKSVTISLCDSNYHVLNDYMGNELVFAKNPKKTHKDWFPDNFKRVRYSFAEDNYILPFPNDAKFVDNTYIIVKDVKGKKYKKYTYKLKIEDVYDVHQNIGDWTELNKLKETPKPNNEFHHKITINLSK